MTLIELTFHTQWPTVVLLSSALGSKIGLLLHCSIVPPIISSPATATELLDCSPIVQSYSLSTIHHECQRGG